MAIVDISAGRTDLMLGNLPEFVGQIRGGGVRLLAFGGREASPLLPDAPLISADLPDYVVTNWFGVAGPGGMATAVLERWNGAIRRAAADPLFQRRMTENGMEIAVGTPDAFRDTIRADRRRWGEVIRAAGIRAD